MCCNKHVSTTPHLNDVKHQHIYQLETIELNNIKSVLATHPTYIYILLLLILILLYIIIHISISIYIYIHIYIYIYIDPYHFYLKQNIDDV